MSPSKPNRLKHESSPYLQQHAHNPVDWYPWGDEALRRAKAEDKPIFLSIGYSACHWCHVMERESFENDETARLMNEHFINIKVDREERPDLDQIYMAAVQIMTQHGGWPMSVFLTPALEPFYGGTYFPDEDRHGMPSFRRVLSGVATAWKSRREDVNGSAKQLVAALGEIHGAVPGIPAAPLSLALVDKAAEAAKRAFDPRHGGFGGAPKFFHAMNVRVSLRHGKRTGDPSSLGLVRLTLDHWQRGGIHDQLGGGFHRYSTDAEWLVPHFEKMLYDNALLAELYTEAYLALAEPEFARTTRDTLDYVLREMTAGSGGFFSTQDADSEGVEGKYYVWTREEVRRLLGPDLAEPFCYVYDITDGGNWEGHNIPRRVRTLDEAAAQYSTERAWLEDNLATARRKLLAERAKRVAPGRDEKILASWNGMMIHAMARAHQALGDERYLEAARRGARFVLDSMSERRPDGTLRLWHAHKDGRSRFNGYLDDYAEMANACVTLFESDFDPAWLKSARELAQAVESQFADPSGTGFFYTSADHEKLVTRVKDTQDGATPSGSSMAITALARLGRITGESRWIRLAEKALEAVEPLLRTAPMAAGQGLVAVDFLLDRPKEIVIVPAAGEQGAETRDGLLQVARERFLPGAVVAVSPPGGGDPTVTALFRSRPPVGNRTTVYLCEGTTCREPIHDPHDLAKALEG